MNQFTNNDVMKIKITVNDIPYSILVSNYSAYNVNDIAKIIWKDKRYLKAIETKSYNEQHNNGKFIRPTMMAYDICIDRDEIIEYLYKWCHRDQTAKSDLANFDFNDVRIKINNVLRQVVQDRLSKLSIDYENKRLILAAILNGL